VLPAAQKNRFTFCFFEIPDKSVFVFHQVHIGSLDFAVTTALFNFCHDELETVPVQGGGRRFLELLDIPQRYRIVDTGSFGDQFQAGLPGRGGGFADSCATINLIVEDKYREVLRAKICQCWKIEE
jgi:hypothetical protein